jgi:hypothetical protein
MMPDASHSRPHDPEEPTLHLLLGEVHERTGLTDLADEAYAEARTLDFCGVLA